MVIAAEQGGLCGLTMEPSTLTDDSRWNAVTARDRGHDGRFVFAVRTTGIYCRPSCPARMPRRANVTFHESPEAARRAGFRACKRCRPDESAADALQTEAVGVIARLIDREIAADRPVPSLGELADRAGYSAFHFHRMFKRALGITPKAYAAAARNRRLGEALCHAPSVTDAIYEAGFSSGSRFYEAAAARLGMSPTARRTGGSGEAIRFGVERCSLGLLLVAATRTGVCTIEFGDDEAVLAGQLAARFPRAELSVGDREFVQMVSCVVAMVETPHEGREVPLDVRGTAFQERVWQALRRIPLGDTASYAAIAQTIGQPNAVRGVAGACAANPVAVAIPCHRVVRSDGGLSGYRWGRERKAALLAREQAG